MENATMTGRTDAPNTYDYRMYDRIWQRVSPDLDPYPEVRAAQDSTAAPPRADKAGGTDPAAVSPSVPASDTSELPGAEKDPCCMGSQADDSVNVITGFINDELADSRCCAVLSRQVRDPRAARLFRRIAGEKQAAARDLRAAYYLITGTCYTPVITLERRQWKCLADILRSCYHQEACSGFNYLRAVEGAPDLCLEKLFTRLGEAAHRRADEVLELLGKIIG